jgi:hypothetical protein
MGDFMAFGMYPTKCVLLTQCSGLSSYDVRDYMVTPVLLPKFGIDTHMYLSCSYIRYSLQNIGVLYLFVVATQFNVDKGLNFFAFVGFIFKD